MGRGEYSILSVGRCYFDMTWNVLNMQIVVKGEYIMVFTWFSPTALLPLFQNHVLEMTAKFFKWFVAIM